MAVYSMTGYATAQTGGPSAANVGEPAREPKQPLGIEIRSVNSRFLDLSFKLPDDLRASEPAIRELLTATLKRGKVEVRAWVEGRADAGQRAPSAPELQKLLGMQDNIRAWLPTAAPLSVAEVLQFTARQQGNTGELHEALLKLAQTGLDSLLAARAREGQRLADMLLDRLKQLRQLAQDAAEDRVLDILVPPPRPVGFGDEPKTDGAARQIMRKRLREGQLDDKEIELELADKAPTLEVLGPQGMEEMAEQLKGLFGQMQSGKRKTRKRNRARNATRA